MLWCSAAVTSKNQSASLIVRFYPLKRKESSPVATAGSQRLGYISNVMAHCPFTYNRACRQTLPFLLLLSHNYRICSRRFIGRNWIWRFSVTERSSGSTRHQSAGCLLLEVQTLKRGCQFGFIARLYMLFGPKVRARRRVMMEETVRKGCRGGSDTIG